MRLRLPPAQAVDRTVAVPSGITLLARCSDDGNYGATLTPYEGAAYFSQEGEAKRKALNQWIRTSGMYDGVIDFEAVVRDPAAPTKIQLGTKLTGDAILIAAAIAVGCALALLILAVRRRSAETARRESGTDIAWPDPETRPRF